MTSLKGLVAVSLFLASTLAATALSPPTAIEWSHDTVVSGGEVTVKVAAAPCHPVEVILTLTNGMEVHGWVTEAPGECTLKVPEGCSGHGYTLEVKCPNDRSSSQGVVM
jgi:hypothetical protein